MKAQLIGSSSLLAIAVLLASAAQAADAQIGAVIQEDYSGASGIRVGAQPEELRFKRDVFSNEKVVTDAQGSTVLQFLDESQLHVGASSLVLLDKFVYDPTTQVGDAALSFTKGAFRFVTGKMQNEQDIKLQTPRAALVIRGTRVEIYLQPDGTEVVYNDRGHISVKACGNGGTVDLRVGTAAKIDYVCNISVGVISAPHLGVPSLISFTPISTEGSQPGTTSSPQVPSFPSSTDPGPPDHTDHTSSPPAHSPPSPARALAAVRAAAPRRISLCRPGRLTGRGRRASRAASAGRATPRASGRASAAGRRGGRSARVGTGRSSPGTLIDEPAPAQPHDAVGARPAAALAATPPASTSTCGATSAIWRSRNGRQAAISAPVGLRLPGGRQKMMLVM